MKLLVVLVGVICLIPTVSFKKGTKSTPKFTNINFAELVTVTQEREVNLNPQKFFGIFEKSYLAFCDNLGFQESSNNYKAINKLGYVGKYQFGTSTLRWVGIRNKRKFLRSPVLQEEALKALIAKNKYLLRDYVNKQGCQINGVLLTESGLIAAAHLGGAGNVKKFLESNGKIVFKDANNVPITKYMKQFANYDLSAIPANRNAIAKL